MGRASRSAPCLNNKGRPRKYPYSFEPQGASSALRTGSGIDYDCKFCSTQSRSLPTDITPLWRAISRPPRMRIIVGIA